MGSQMLCDRISALPGCWEQLEQAAIRMVCLGGISAMGMQALTLFYQTEESREGVNAFLEKRPPKFRKGS